MAMMPFMGVRISWLMLARKSALARAAASAATRAASNSRLVWVNSSCKCLAAKRRSTRARNSAAIERLGEVIDGAEFKSAQFAFGAVPGRNHDHRKCLRASGKLWNCDKRVNPSTPGRPRSSRIRSNLSDLTNAIAAWAFWTPKPSCCPRAKGPTEPLAFPDRRLSTGCEQGPSFSRKIRCHSIAARYIDFARIEHI